MGLSDLAVRCADGAARKIAGNAQARKKHSVLIHGTLLASPDWGCIARLLRHPSSVPEYRGGRDDRAFLTSLHEQGAPHDLASFAEGFAQTLGCGIHRSGAPSAEEQQRAARLLVEKYDNPAWNLRR
jgi:lipoate-protein ligase A